MIFCDWRDNVPVYKSVKNKCTVSDMVHVIQKEVGCYAVLC